MKKLLAAVAALAAFSAQAESLNIAATAVPHAEILEFVKPTLAAEGVELNIKVSLDVSLRCDQEREHGYGGYRSGTPLCYYDNYYFYIRVNYDDIHVRTRSNLCL